MKLRLALTLASLLSAPLLPLTPAAALTEREVAGPAIVARASGPECFTGVYGVTHDRRVVRTMVRGNRVLETRTWAERLRYDVTALGVLDDRTSDDGRLVTRFEAVTADGTPRMLTVTTSGEQRLRHSSRRLGPQTGFTASLFAEGPGFHAYTINGSGRLARYTVTGRSTDSLRFGQRVLLPGRHHDVTALQSGLPVQVRGAWRDVLFAVTGEGELRQLTVPRKRPDRLRSRTLLRSASLVGTTQLSNSLCNGREDHQSLVAIDPAEGTAGWVTIKGVSTPTPVTTWRGLVRGTARWDLAAAV